MARKKLYTGLVLEDDYLKIARISVSGKKAILEGVDRVKLVSGIKKVGSEKESEDIFDAFDSDLEEDTIFGIEDDDADDDFGIDFDDDDSDDLNLDLDLDELDDSDESLIDIDDMAQEPGASALASSNELLVYNLLTDIDSSSAKMSLNIPAGATIFQILKDIDFSSIKKKDLQIIVDDRLESLYGTPKAQDFYSTVVREDGSLLLVSIDDSPQILDLIHSSENIYNGKITINQILPDEILLIGLFKSNYEIEHDSITALVQFAEESCRVIFLQGDTLLVVSPLIAEGTVSTKFLNTVFSKVLFQLDTGEVPNLDRIILCNNTLGNKAVSFFQDRFPDIEVSNFQFNSELFECDLIDTSTVNSFTTAIALAWADAGFQKEQFPSLNFVPEYIRERQKIFKLQWHGVLLLVMILAVFPVTNYFYQVNSDQLDGLREEVSIKKGEIQGLESIVQDYNQVNNDLSGIQNRLVLLDELSEGTLRWTVNLDLVNKGIDNIDSIWLTTIQEDESGALDISGIALYRNRIPMVADIFSEAILIDVQRSLIREKEVFTFTYRVPKIISNQERYTPESAKGLKEILGAQ